VLWLHGFGQDEHSFVEHVAPLIDEAIFTGKMPPVIVAAPDGSIEGEPNLFRAGSFFLNSNLGDFQDYLLEDVWDFVVFHYPIRPERQAHVIAGYSMGGFSAYNLAFKHREAFGVVVGIAPPLNLRWVNGKGKYFADFDPKDWGWRTKVDQGNEVIARFYGGALTVRLRKVLDPLFGTGSEALFEVARENPIEMIDRLQVRPGELCMYVGYGGKDEFNIDAQVESFLYLARWRGLKVKVGYEPKGHHNYATAKKLFPGVIEWLAPLIAPYSPPTLVACKAACPPPSAQCGPCAPTVPCAACSATPAKPELPAAAPAPPAQKQRLPDPTSSALLPPASRVESPAEARAKPDISLAPGANYEPSCSSPSTPSTGNPNLVLPSWITGGN
jgi:pimeloyl-ACP methyl ester carboxylesterase